MKPQFVQTSEMYLEDDIPHIEMKNLAFVIRNSTRRSWASPKPVEIYFHSLYISF
jgi:hypothetical protein